MVIKKCSFLASGYFHGLTPTFKEIDQSLITIYDLAKFLINIDFLYLTTEFRFLNSKNNNLKQDQRDLFLISF